MSDPTVKLTLSQRCESTITECLSLEEQDEAPRTTPLEHGGVPKLSVPARPAVEGTPSGKNASETDSPKTLTKMSSPVSARTLLWSNPKLFSGSPQQPRVLPDYNLHEDRHPDIPKKTGIKLPLITHEKPNREYPVLLPFRPALRPMTVEARILETLPPHHFNSNRRALIIGISYCWTEGRKNIPVHTHCAKRWFDILVRRFGFRTDEIWILTDMYMEVTGNARLSHPTSENIQHALRWLITDVRRGDKLFFSYNGNTIGELDKHELSNYSTMSAILPSDCDKAVLSAEQLMNFFMAVPSGVNLTAVLDCKKSYELVKLPNVYFAKKSKRNAPFEIHQAPTIEVVHQMGVVNHFAKLLQQENVSSVDGMVHQLYQHCSQTREQLKNRFRGCGNIFCFSRSPKKSLFFKNYGIPGFHTLSDGEFSSIILEIMEDCFRTCTPVTHRQLLLEIAARMTRKGFCIQFPQLISSVDVSMNDSLSL